MSKVVASRSPRAKTGGRKKGTPNKATADIKAIARKYTEQAMEALADIMLNGESEAARVAAIKEILDRGYGKASTVLSGDEDGGPLRIVSRIELIGVRPNGDSPA